MIRPTALLLLLSALAVHPALAADGLDFLNKANKLLEEKRKLKETVSESVQNPDERLKKGSAVEGSQESKLIAKYPRSILKSQQTNDLTRVILPLSSNLRSDQNNYQKLKLTGEQSVYIYDVPNDVSKSYFKVFNTLKENLKDAGFKGLWECDSADQNCGYFFPRQFIYTDRGEDSSKIFRGFDGLDNFVDGNSDYAIYTGKTLRKNQTYFITVIVGQYRSQVQYSFEIVKADDPMQDSEDTSAAQPSASEHNASEAPKAESGIHALVKKSHGSNLKAEYTNDLTRVVFPLSSNLRDTPETYKKLKLTGEQHVQIYEVPVSVSKSYFKVLTQLKQNLASSGFEALWQCDSADSNCGYFFPRRFIFNDRGEDASNIYRNFDGLDNFVDGSTDYGIYTGKIVYKNQPYFILVIVGNYRSEVKYSIEIMKADDPLATNKK